jgi:hypothetical protein
MFAEGVKSGCSTGRASPDKTRSIFDKIRLAGARRIGRS